VTTADELTAIAARVRDLFARVERVCLERIEPMASDPGAPPLPSAQS
jgi:hypothetical protein